MIKIDGRTFDVPVVDVGRKVEFTYDFAERNEKHELLKGGDTVFLTFDIEARNVKKNSEYAALFNKLIEVPNTHDITLWLEDGEYTFPCYFSPPADRLVSIKDGVRYNTLKFKAIPLKPYRR